MNKQARAIRDEYNVPYTTALRWIKELGLEGALEKAANREGAAPDLLQDLDRIGDKIKEQHLTRDYRPVDAAFDRVRVFVIEALKKETP